MATWYDVRGYLGANYSIAQDAGHQVQMFCAGGDGEVQLMIVEQGNVAASLVDSWVSVSSPVGSSNYVDVNAMLAHVSQHYIVGGLVRVGESIMLRHAIPVAGMRLQDFLVPFQLVLNAASELTRTFMPDNDPINGRSSARRSR